MWRREAGCQTWGMPGTEPGKADGVGGLGLARLCLGQLRTLRRLSAESFIRALPAVQPDLLGAIGFQDRRFSLSGHAAFPRSRHFSDCGTRVAEVTPEGPQGA